jgi:hypothetical protein
VIQYNIKQISGIYFKKPSGMPHAGKIFAAKKACGARYSMQSFRTAAGSE